MICPSAIVYEPDSKPCHHKDNISEDVESIFFGTKDCEGEETDSLPFKLKEGDRLRRTFDFHRNISENTLRNEKLSSISSYDFYSKKSVKEWETVPEIIICCKEYSDFGVKDICVDEGIIRSTDKILIESDEDDLTSTYLNNEKVDIETPVMENDVFKNSALKNTETDNFIEEKADMELNVLDELKSSDVNHMNGEIESGNITFHFDSSTPTSIDRKESPQNANSEPPLLETLKALFKHEDDETSNDLRVSVEAQPQHDHGESSFAPFSGLITHSGPIAYSGRLSIRSDSSTTSTQSFAFPVLQTEWNSSPVRMAKPVRRHFRNHKGWRQIFLCFRF